MKSVLLVSHGNLAESMAETVKLFLGDDLEQFETVCLKPEDNIDEFGDRIGEAVDRLNGEDGVIVLCDLFGGSPANRAVRFLSDKVRVVTGVNLCMLMEVLSERTSGQVTAEDAIAFGRYGIRECDPFKAAAGDDFFD